MRIFALPADAEKVFNLAVNVNIYSLGGLFGLDLSARLSAEKITSSFALDISTQSVLYSEPVLL